MKGILLNFSGHRLSAEAAQTLSKRYDAVLTPTMIEFDFSADAENQLTGLMDSIPVLLDGTTPITIIPPGQSTLAILLVSFLHGLLGHFPKICYLEMADSGIYLPRIEYEIAVQAVRSSGRKYRSKVLSNPGFDG